MKRAIILHGTTDKEECYNEIYPSLSNSHWYPWMQKQLLINDILTQTPEMPTPYDAKYDEWKKEFERFFSENTILLIGHSYGGGFFVRWLSENKVSIEKLVLVAPWMDLNKEENPNFFDFTIDKTLHKRIREIHILFSEDDHQPGIRETVALLRKEIPTAIVHTFDNKGHFVRDDMNSEEFPELLKIILE